MLFLKIRIIINVITTIPEFDVVLKSNNEKNLSKVKIRNGVNTLIERIHVRNYRTFNTLDLKPKDGMNIIVGNNDAGKSTLLEAISLVLNGRLNGRWIGDELNPYWFNTEVVRDFFDAYNKGEEVMPPSILIELYFGKEDQPQKLRGKNNSFSLDCPGVSLSVEPDPEYSTQIQAYLQGDHPPLLPVEYYKINWKGFDGNALNKRPMELKTAIIDGRTIRSTRGIDIQTRQLLSDYIDGKDSADISVAYRQAKYQLTETMLKQVNQQIQEGTRDIHSHELGLQLDQSSSANWESAIIPHIDSVPFSMAGQGQQVLMKLALALKSSEEKSNFVIIEEPENHLSHTSLTGVVNLIDRLSSGRQTFIATHSSYVLNRLGLDRLILIHKGQTAKFDNLSADTIEYFKKQSGYDTLRLVLARKLVIVEGPTDEMLFNRAYFDSSGKYPIDDEIDVVTQGTRNRRALELCHVLNRSVAVLRDVDKQTPEYWKDKAKEYLKDGEREMFIGLREAGETLEPQVIFANQTQEPTLKTIVGCPEEQDLCSYMTSNKTEVAWLIANSPTTINYPQYFLDAIRFVKSI